MAGLIAIVTFILVALTTVGNIEAGRQKRACYTPTFGGTAHLSRCVWPFTYKKVTYQVPTCAVDDSRPWCYTSYNYEADQQWGYCAERTCSRRRRRSAEDRECFTPALEESGYTGNKCMFPFVYRGEVYEDCALTDDGLPWCYTSTNTSSWAICLAERCKARSDDNMSEGPSDSSESSESGDSVRRSESSESEDSVRRSHSDSEDEEEKPRYAIRRRQMDSEDEQDDEEGQDGRHPSKSEDDDIDEDNDDDNDSDDDNKDSDDDNDDSDDDNDDSDDDNDDSEDDNNDDSDDDNDDSDDDNDDSNDDNDDDSDDDNDDDDDD